VWCTRGRRHRITSTARFIGRDHGIPPGWCAARSGMVRAGPHIGVVGRTSPAMRTSRRRCPRTPRRTVSHPVLVGDRRAHHPEPTRNFQSGFPLFASTALNHPSASRRTPSTRGGDSHRSTLGTSLNLPDLLTVRSIPRDRGAEMAAGTRHVGDRALRGVRDVHRLDRLSHAEIVGRYE
jgi:hypothetical protein